MNKVNSYEIENVVISVEKTNDIEKLRNKDLNTIFAVVDGGLKSDNDLLVLAPEI